MKIRVIKFLFISLILLGCKKYPENTLWFTRINKIPFFENVAITSYKVNGIDSLDLLSEYLTLNVPKMPFSENKFKDEYNTYEEYRNAILYLGNASIGSFPYSYSKNKKFIQITGVSSNTLTYSKQLFPNAEIEWEIIKLEKEGLRKIRKIAQGNTYEIEFEKIN